MPEAIESGSVAFAPRQFTRREAASACVFAAVAAACSAGLCVVALLLHPPVGAIPLLVIVCVGAPVYGTWQLPRAITSLRATRVSHREAIARMRRSLAELPEIDHPLGH